MQLPWSVSVYIVLVQSEIFLSHSKSSVTPSVWQFEIYISSGGQFPRGKPLVTFSPLQTGTFEFPFVVGNHSYTAIAENLCVFAK